MLKDTSVWERPFTSPTCAPAEATPTAPSPTERIAVRNLLSMMPSQFHKEALNHSCAFHQGLKLRVKLVTLTARLKLRPRKISTNSKVIILCVRFSTACSGLRADRFDEAMNASVNQFNDANQPGQDERSLRRCGPPPPGSLSNIEHSCPAMNIGACLSRLNRNLTLCPSTRKPLLLWNTDCCGEAWESLSRLPRSPLV